ncbi:hypothetical protein PR003_g4855 [Phytophthora rubi]|uniref:Chromo domain-containing protein n=1 Tax=Phytophthora rubi TaxID=129364 RepID=A0A6A4G4B7_9STRA|nr:hypothetical protein PR003_g4855 [Phytophthora rubi]
MSAEVLQRSREQHLAQMAEALEAMHRDVAETSDRRRMQARARRASKSKPPNFSVGDFVLVAMVTQHANKLTIDWQGPNRIVRAISDWVFEVESLNPPQGTTTHHVSRLRFYAEASRGVTEDLLQYALHSQGGHLVEAFRGVRFNEAARRWEVEVKWLGIEAIENTWEPLFSAASGRPSTTRPILYCTYR